MIERIAIEGIDGAGKTTTCQALSDLLQDDGYKTMTFAPYRLANEKLGEDIYNLWFDPTSCVKAIDAFSDVIDECEQVAASNKADVIIYDRHWMTALGTIEGREMSLGHWLQYGPKFVQTALLRVPVETAIERRADEIANGSDTFMNASDMGRDAAVRDRLAKQYSEHVLGIYRSDNDLTPETIARNIAWDMRIRR